MKNVGNSSRGRSQGVPKIQGPMYMAHRAVIFATAQLSCYTWLLPRYAFSVFAYFSVFRDSQFQQLFG